MSIQNKFIMLLEFPRLRSKFKSFFRVVPATSQALINESYKVRHQVYCTELGWEAVREDKMEHDEYDPHALHCLLEDTRRKKYIGCIRLILPNPNNPDQPLPFQISCAGKLDPDVPDPRLRQSYAIAEVSRLAVVGEYRRRRHERLPEQEQDQDQDQDQDQEEDKAISINKEDFGNVTRPRFPYIPVGLYMGMLQMAKRQGIKKLYILTEPSLADHFCRLGGKLTLVGGSIEHRGIRRPYVMDVEDVINNMSRIFRPLFNHIRDEVDSAYDSPPATQKTNDSSLLLDSRQR